MHNHDKWLALAKKSPTEQARPQTQHTQPQSAGIKRKEMISPTSATSITKPSPVTPQVPAFDINDIYNKIHNEKKLKEQKVNSCILLYVIFTNSE